MAPSAARVGPKLAAAPRAMLFTDFAGRRAAVRLELVQRIETAPVSAIDRSAPRPRVVIDGTILPLIVGGEAKALAMMGQLREAGLFIPAIRYPTVARNEARLRVTVSASHSSDDLQALLESLAR